MISFMTSELVSLRIVTVTTSLSGIAVAVLLAKVQDMISCVPASGIALGSKLTVGLAEIRKYIVISSTYMNIPNLTDFHLH